MNTTREREREVHSNRENGQRGRVGEGVEIQLHPQLTATATATAPFRSILRENDFTLTKMAELPGNTGNGSTITQSQMINDKI